MATENWTPEQERVVNASKQCGATFVAVYEFLTHDCNLTPDVEKAREAVIHAHDLFVKAIRSSLKDVPPSASGPVLDQ